MPTNTQQETQPSHKVMYNAYFSKYDLDQLRVKSRVRMGDSEEVNHFIDSILVPFLINRTATRQRKSRFGTIGSYSAKSVQGV